MILNKNILLSINMDAEQSPAGRLPREGLDSVVEEMGSLLNHGGQLRIQRNMFSDLSQKSHEGQLAAVDGSSAIIIRGPNFIVGAYRSCALVYRGHRQEEKLSSPFSVRCISKENMNELYHHAFSEFVGEAPERDVRDLETVLQRLRVIEEMKMISRLAEVMEEGGIILVDGALRSTINRMDAFMEGVFGRAIERSLAIVGISKSSSLSMGRVPMVPMVQLEAERLMDGPASSWLIELDESMVEGLRQHRSHLFGAVNVVKFNPFSEFVFRTDVLVPRGDTRDVIERITQYCNDPSYLGYPYPLAAVHNEVSITRGFREDLGHEMKSMAMDRGIGGLPWRILCQDFHDILDRGV